ncbi:hypothetical protein CCACVL1_06534 [Corchorus capsularis]|uniref:Uncharacterized protein n=1 Tax=Corchorus capsularis TaxID=210143 RepID=A0A1R3JEV3_COCAP|nr:hypothetical protein CCACVL1_06534 [Corchorus capsularis]
MVHKFTLNGCGGGVAMAEEGGGFDPGNG